MYTHLSIALEDIQRLRPHLPAAHHGQILLIRLIRLRKTYTPIRKEHRDIAKAANHWHLQMIPGTNFGLFCFLQQRVTDCLVIASGLIGDCHKMAFDCLPF